MITPTDFIPAAESFTLQVIRSCLLLLLVIVLCIISSLLVCSSPPPTNRHLLEAQLTNTLVS